MSVAYAGPFTDSKKVAKKTLTDSAKKKEAKKSSKKRAKGKGKKGKETEILAETNPEEREFVRLMENHGDNPNASLANGSSLLMQAVKEQKLLLARKLVEKGADVNAVDPGTGLTPLQVAVSGRDMPMLELLLEKGADTSACKWTPLYIALIRGKKDEATRLIADGADVNSQDVWGCTPLHWAAALGDEAILSQLLEKGAGVNALNADGESALCYAAKGNHTQALRLLLDKGAKANVTNYPPMIYAVRNNNARMVRLLLSKGGDAYAMDKTGDTAWKIASDSGFADITQILMEQ